ncbi:MAG: tetratricopeptide repeat protein [Myxococcota bacterium]|nr:tetratricopeptide repeat protein [Myxococcota bacterium]
MRATNWKTRQICIFVAIIGISMACGSSQVSEKQQRQSERFYEAASIAWFEQKDTLAAIRNLTRSIDTDPNNDHAHYLLGIIRFSRGEYDAAETHFLKTAALRDPVDPAGLAGVRNNLGLLLIHQKKYTEAVPLLEASAKEVLNREPWLAMGNLGWAYIELGEYDKAIEILKRAMFDQPKYCVGLYRLGQAYYMKQDYDSARAALEQAIGVPEPGCDAMQEAYHLLGMTYLRLELDDDAKRALNQCLGLNENSDIGAICSEALNGL